VRRIRKIIGTDSVKPLIRQGGKVTIIKKGYDKRKESRTNAPENIPVLPRKEHQTTLQRNQKFEISRIQPIWAGETVYLIGGGPSLAGFNWKGLIGKRTIAINKSILTYPQADALYWTDSRVYGWYKSEIDNFNGLKYTIRNHHTYSQDVKILKKGTAFGLEESNDTLAHGNNSGYAAINLAYHLGAKRIILLGYDMRNDGSKGHYHDGYPVPVTGDNIYRDQFMPGFGILSSILKEKKIEVYNASMTSALTVWPKITFDQALSFR
jgi:hypothetical protein